MKTDGRKKNPTPDHFSNSSFRILWALFWDLFMHYFRHGTPQVKAKVECNVFFKKNPKLKINKLFFFKSRKIGLIWTTDGLNEDIHYRNELRKRDTNPCLWVHRQCKIMIFKILAHCLFEKRREIQFYRVNFVSFFRKLQIFIE